MQRHYNKFKKISGGVAQFEKQWSTQKYIENNGMVMHGIYSIEYKKTIHKYYINNGYLMRRYIYPIIRQKFNSLMVNDYNQHLCGGWHFLGIERTECLTRVTQGLKPIGHFVTNNYNEYNYWLKYCAKYNLKYIKYNINESNRYEIGLSIDAKFGDIFDMHMLINDYTEYSKAMFCKELASEWIEDMTGFLSIVADKKI